MGPSGIDGRDARTLARDLRATVPDAVAAVAVSGMVFWVLVARLRAGTDAAALNMPQMVSNGGVWPYSLSQAFGWTALAWSWWTILLGVSLPIWARGRRPRLRQSAERLHRAASLTLVGLMFVHALLLVWDKMGDTLVSSFVPWTTSYLPGLLPQTLGILSFYLAVLLGLSFYLRDRLGPRAWLWLHRYFVPGVYVLAVWHSFAYGSDLQTRGALWMALWAFQVPVAAAFIVRLLPVPRHQSKNPPFRRSRSK